MKLYKLFKGVKCKIIGDKKIEVLALSQKVEKCLVGSLFFCFNGVNFDGHDFAKDAVKKGAVAIVVEKFLKDIHVTQILVKDTRSVMVKICDNFFGNLASHFKFVGVTGTNGKTTTTDLIYNVLNFSGKRAGLIGTNGIKFGLKSLEQNFTTPDTIDLFYILHEMKKAQIEFVIMEVSAHALDLKKLLGIKFEIGIFTNLTQDHLDYFGTMGKYALAKQHFLSRTYCRNLLVNTDDDYGKLFVRLSNCKTFTFGIDEPADNFAIDLKLNEFGSEFLINILDNAIGIRSRLTCKFNVYNILACCLCCKLLGTTCDDIKNGVMSVKSISGRMNCFKLKNGATIIVDFAHTPDGLGKVLLSIREWSQNKKIVTIFGCGGDRDKSKRHKMGEIANRLSDKIVLTNDNPRWEDENEIIEDILLDIKESNKYEIVLDRKVALEKTIELSSEHDIILVAGKGAEKTQEVKGVFYPYNDFDIIKKFL